MTDATHELNCPFCRLISKGDLPGNEFAAYFADGYPVSPGHTLIVPRRHVTNYLDASTAEKRALWELVDDVCTRATAERAAAGFNVGINVGVAAGQTVMHLHVHVIPRYEGDMADPRGGIRHVIPEKAKYWE